MTTDIFIKTCNHDAPYHGHCLASIEKYCTGFRKTVVEQGEHPRGYLHQQAIKLHADVFTDADYILVTDSDTLFTIPVTPETYFRDGKPIWIHTPYDEAMKINPGTGAWFLVMQQFFDKEPQYEFMRRQPFFFPRWILSELRNYCFRKFGRGIEQYIMDKGQFSEWNILGMFAWENYRDSFYWVNTAEEPLPELTVRQFWSHDPVEKNLAEIRKILK